MKEPLTAEPPKVLWVLLACCFIHVEEAEMLSFQIRERTQ